MLATKTPTTTIHWYRQGKSADCLWDGECWQRKYIDYAVRQSTKKTEIFANYHYIGEKHTNFPILCFIYGPKL